MPFWSSSGKTSTVHESGHSQCAPAKRKCHPCGGSGQYSFTARRAGAAADPDNLPVTEWGDCNPCGGTGSL